MFPSLLFVICSLLSFIQVVCPHVIKMAAVMPALTFSHKLSRRKQVSTYLSLFISEENLLQYTPMDSPLCLIGQGCITSSCLNQALSKGIELPLLAWTDQYSFLGSNLEPFSLKTLEDQHDKNQGFSIKEEGSS